MELGESLLLIEAPLPLAAVVAENREVDVVGNVVGEGGEGVIEEEVDVDVESSISWYNFEVVSLRNYLGSNLLGQSAWFDTP